MMWIRVCRIINIGGEERERVIKDNPNIEKLK
jgi:hypothetical protein